MIKTRQLFDQDTWTFTYLLFDDETKEAIFIDPVLEQMERDLSLIDRLNLKLIAVLETHVHADHVTSANEIRKLTDVKVYYGSKSGIDCADVLLDDGDHVKIGNEFIIAIHTPGHTVGCTTYLVDNNYLRVILFLLVEQDGLIFKVVQQIVLMKVVVKNYLLCPMKL